MEIPLRLYNKIKSFLRKVSTYTNDGELINEAFDISEELSMVCNHDFININGVSLLKKKALEWKERIESGHKIDCIKEIRSLYNIGLKEGKEIVDKIEETKSLFLC